MTAQRSLSFLVAVWTAVAVAASMAVYAVFQYLTTPGTSAGELILTHLWHVLVLGAVIHILCFLVLRRIVVRPLRRIYFHLYGVGAGQLEELTLRTSVKEIQTIVSGVNLMQRRMLQTFDPSAVDRCQEKLAKVRELARASDSAVSGEGEALLDQIAGLEASLKALSPSSIDAMPFAGRDEAEPVGAPRSQPLRSF